MTEKQFEALKAWINATRAVDQAEIDSVRYGGIDALLSVADACKALDEAEEWARLQLVED